MDSGEDRVDLLARIALASMERWSLTKIGLRFVCCSLNRLSRKESRICVGSMRSYIDTPKKLWYCLLIFLQPYISRRFRRIFLYSIKRTFYLWLETGWTEETGCLPNASDHEVLFICSLNFDSWVCKFSILLERSDTAFCRALCSVDRYCWVNLVTVDSIDLNFASSFPSSYDRLLKRLKAFGRFITQKLKKKKMFLEGDSNITNSLCLILAQVLCSHCSHQQHTIHSSETALWQVTHISSFTDLSAGLSGELVELLILFVVVISI